MPAATSAPCLRRLTTASKHEKAFVNDFLASVMQTRKLKVENHPQHTVSKVFYPRLTKRSSIKKEFPNAKFGPRRKYGFAPTDPEYNRVFTFAKRGFKSAFEIGKFKILPKYAQQ